MAYILFDCDGTVVNSEALAMPFVANYLVDIAQKQGVTVEPDVVKNLFGKTHYEMTWLLHNIYGIKFQEGVEELMHAEVVRMLAEKATATEGMGAFLERTVCLGHQPVIVTSSALDRVVPSLKRAGVFRYFQKDAEELIFSAVSTLDPPEPKPSPAIYHFILNKLGIKPDETIAFEDSGSGVESADAANVPVIGYLGGSHINGNQNAIGNQLISKGAKALISSWEEAERYLPPLAHKPAKHPRAPLFPKRDYC